MIRTLAITAATAMATLFVASQAEAQYYQCPPVCQPPVVIHRQPVYVAPAEHHVLVNHGTVHSKFYVNVYLKKHNHRARIPVINGYLPSINVTKYTDGSVKLVMDYSEKYPYQQYAGHKDDQGAVIYGDFKRAAPDLNPMGSHGDNTGGKTPAPKLNPPKVGEDPLPSERLPAPTWKPAMPKPYGTKPPAVIEEIPPVTPKVDDRTRKIEDLLKKLDTSDTHGSTPSSGIARPSEVTQPPSREILPKYRD